MTPPQYKDPRAAAIEFRLSPHWSPAQALAVFEFIELLRDQLWLAYGPEIQLAWRADLMPDRAPSAQDSDTPF